MELFRHATNPWGQDILIGVSWTLIWAAAIAGALFMIGHALYVWRGGSPKRGSATGGLSGGRSSPAGADAGADIPERITRHTIASRLFHWTMAAAMLTLLVTAFFPILDIRFDWVPIHYIAGLVLIGAVLYHIIHATFWQDLWSMWIGKDDIREGIRMAKEVLGREDEEIEKAGKYPVDHKAYHHMVALAAIAAIVTGVLMMFRIDTPFWDRNLYILSDQGWGLIYVIHGLAGIGLITLIMSHIYFAVRPEKWWITRSMIKGWITRREFVEHHDPAKWKVSANGRRQTTSSGADSPAEREPVAAGDAPGSDGARTPDPEAR